jgi:hypothetical protein
MNKSKQLKDFDPIESKKRKKNKELDNKFDPSRKNKKYYLQKNHEYV